MAAFAHLDATRLSDSIRSNTAKAKMRRQHIALLRSRQEEAVIEIEGGLSYAPGLDEVVAEEEVDIEKVGEGVYKEDEEEEVSEKEEDEYQCIFLVAALSK